ncbi:MAG TPA: hypothetical protein VG274_00100 [Rhizomicrobium sp.]|nr:hypothetical protein [Rhizomicrobium sp.]
MTQISSKYRGIDVTANPRENGFCSRRLDAIAQKENRFPWHPGRGIMKHRIHTIAFALAMAGALAACADSSDDSQAAALAQWKAYCGAQHKQFYWRDTEKARGMLEQSVKVEGKCVGPGERGYEPPEPPDTSP